MRTVGDMALNITKEISVAIAANQSVAVTAENAEDFAEFMQIIYNKAKELVSDADTIGHTD